MINGEEQHKEIETIKERSVILRLSEADCKRIAEKAGRAGLSVGELLEGFIGDLVDGTYSHGSDERMYAEQWYDRCGFSYVQEIEGVSFLQFLMDFDQLDDVLELWSDIKCAKEEIAHAEAHPDEWEPEELAEVRDDLAEWQQELNDIWNEYVKGKNNGHREFDEEMQKVLAWQADYQRLLW